MLSYFWVALGSALGGMARFALAEWLPVMGHGSFPLATFLANVLGSVAIGVAFATLSGDPARLFLMVGVLGGFTTFSTFSLQTLLLMTAGRIDLALLNVLGTLVCCLIGVWSGVKLAGLILP
ncbi:MAG: fluoride efflux transporter CrcB [Geminicoccaceae bacterium]